MDDGQRQQDVVIGNVSTHGLMAKCRAVPAKGIHVEIRHGGLIISGRVVWSRNRRFGLQSDRPIDLVALFPPAATPRSPQTARRFMPPAAGRPRPSPAKRGARLNGHSPTAALIAGALLVAATIWAGEAGLVDFAAGWQALRVFVAG
jgi:hypothetical protein